MRPTVLDQLAADARCTSEDDWGSERQIAAENHFFDHVKERLPAGLWNALEGYCLKATTNESIDEALRLVREWEERT